MDEALLQLSVGGIFSILILKEVFSFIKGTDGKENRGICHCSKELKELKDEIEKDHDEHHKSMNELLTRTRELWHWHSKEDESGVKIWYMSGVKKRMDDLIKLIRKEPGS